MLILQRITNCPQRLYLMRQALTSSLENADMIKEYMVAATSIYKHELQLLSDKERKAGIFTYALLDMCREMAGRIREVMPHRGLEGLPFRLSRCRPINYNTDWRESEEGTPRSRCCYYTCIWCWLRDRYRMQRQLPARGLMAHKKFWLGPVTPPEAECRNIRVKLGRLGYRLVARIVRPQIAPLGVTALWLTDLKYARQPLMTHYRRTTFSLLEDIYPYQWRLARASGDDLLEFVTSVSGVRRFYRADTDTALKQEVDSHTEHYVQSARNRGPVFLDL